MRRVHKIGITLLVLIVLATAVFMAQKFLGMGAGYASGTANAEAAPPVGMAALNQEPVKMQPWAQYAELTQRPLFNESRAPEADKNAATAAENAPAAVPALNVTLTGVILTEKLRMAIVTDPAKGSSQRVREGQPLEGEMAGWTLVELKPRMAVFEGAGAGRQELELTTDTKGAVSMVPAPTAMPGFGTAPTMQPTAYPPPAGGNYPAVQPGALPYPDPSLAPPNDEIRRRIEERRRQLREEAERMQQQNNNPAQP